MAFKMLDWKLKTTIESNPEQTKERKVNETYIDKEKILIGSGMVTVDMDETVSMESAEKLVNKVVRACVIFYGTGFLTNESMKVERLKYLNKLLHTQAKNISVTSLSVVKAYLVEFEVSTKPDYVGGELTEKKLLNVKDMTKNKENKIKVA